MVAALKGVAQRVPIYAQMHEFVAHQLGIPGEVFYYRPEIMVPAMLRVQAEYDLDGCSLTYDVYNIEAEGLGQRILRSSAGMPDIDRRQPLINDRADLQRLKTPDFDAAGRFRQVIDMLAIYQYLTGLAPPLTFCAPFSLAANVYGIERLLIAIYEDPEFARSLLDRLTETVLAPWIDYQKAHFPHAVKITGADATASLPIVNLSILEDWALPYIQRLREWSSVEVQVVNWVGERYLKQPAEMLDLKVAAGWGLLQGQDPDVATLGASYYADYAVNNDLPLILGIGAAFLAQSKPADVAERVRQYVEAGKRSPGFALYICNVDAETPAENLRAAVQSVKEHGVYE
jgi:uroporphyrinogen decarboxylase